MLVGFAAPYLYHAHWRNEYEHWFLPGAVLYRLYFAVVSNRWSQGYDGQELFYIDNDVVCYQCGKNVKFLNENGKQTVFAFQGSGIGPFAAHKINKNFAIAERCIDPKIFIYNFPSLEEFVVLQGIV